MFTPRPNKTSGTYQPSSTSSPMVQLASSIVAPSTTSSAMQHEEYQNRVHASGTASVLMTPAPGQQHPVHTRAPSAWKDSTSAPLFTPGPTISVSRQTHAPSTWTHGRPSSALSVASTSPVKGSAQMPSSVKSPRFLLRKSTHQVQAMAGLPSSLFNLLDSGVSFSSKAEPTFGVSLFAFPDRICVWWCGVEDSMKERDVLELPAPYESEPSDTDMDGSPPSAHLPLVAVVPAFGGLSNQSSGDFGVVAVSPQGFVRYWECLIDENALDFSEFSIPIANGETVCSLTRVDAMPGVMILATDRCSLFRLSITMGAGGRTCVTFRPLSRPVSLLSRVTSLLGSSSSSVTGLHSDNQFISTFCGRKVDGGRGIELFVGTSQTVQKWTILKSGESEFGWEANLFSSSILLDMNQSHDSSAIESLDLSKGRVLSFEIAKDGRIIVLVEHHGTDASSLYQGVLALVFLQYSTVTGLFAAVNVKLLQGKCSLSEIPPSLHLSNGGPTLFVYFPGSAVEISSIGKGRFDEIIFIQNLLGIGVDRSRCFRKDAEETSRALLMCHDTKFGFLVVETDNAAMSVSSAAVDIPYAVESPFAKLKNSLEQAVFFRSPASNDAGDDNEYLSTLCNPITFDLNVPDADLGLVAVTLSEEILLSTSPYLRLMDSLDLGSHLNEQLDCLKHLSSLVLSNELLDSEGGPCVSLPHRFALRSDVELMWAANQLWSYQNELLRAEFQDASVSQSLLSRSILNFMRSINPSPSKQDEGSAIRSFFRRRIVQLPELFAGLLESLTQSLDGETLVQLNEILLVVYEAVNEAREAMKGIFGFDGLSADRVDGALVGAKSKFSSIELLKFAYSRTENFFKLFQQKRESDLFQKLESQIPSLANALLLSLQEKSLVATSHAEFEGYKRSLEDAVMTALISLQFRSAAFSLAEIYYLYRTLARLVDSVQDPIEQAQLRDRYVDMFGNSFFFDYAKFIIESGKVSVLLRMHEQHNVYMDQYLGGRSDLSWMSWLHYIRNGAFSAATFRLDQTALHQNNLAKQKVAYSLSKLCYIADQSMESLDDPNSLDHYDNAFGWIALQESLVSKLLEGYRGCDQVPQNDPRGLESFILHHCYSIDKSASSVLYRRVGPLMKNLIAGITVSRDDLIDLMTLCRGPTFSAVKLFDLALEYATKTFELGIGNDTNYWQQIIWRRAFLATDWKAIWHKGDQASDQQTVALLKESSLFNLISSSLQMQIPPPPPEACITENVREYVESRFKDSLSASDMENVIHSLEKENNDLGQSIKTDRLESIVQECVHIYSLLQGKYPRQSSM